MKFDTIALHGGYDSSENKNCVSPPIYQNSAFSFEDVKYAADLFDLKDEGHMYTRISNPTTEVLEKRLALLEGGIGALAVSSGQSACLVAILNIAKSGDEIIATADIYGGTYNLLFHTLKRFGIKTVFIDLKNPLELENAINEKTRCVFVEMITNPGLKVFDIEALANVAHKNNIPLIVDNTVPTPYLFKPFEHGADIIIHSLTKYISGHGNALGGAIIDSGNFDWKKSGKFSELTDKDPSYHGLSYSEAFGKSAYIVKARVQLLRDFGNCISPFNAYLTLLGLETLHLRMKRHSESALKIAKFLDDHPQIEQVSYPLLEGNQNYELSKKYLPKGASSLVSFSVKGGRAAATRFVERAKLMIHATNIGDSRTIVTYPALTTHRQMDDVQLEKCGISNSFIRLSIGLEDIDDIIDDIKQALE